MDITRFCDLKAYELRTEVLDFMPPRERDVFVESLLNDYRRESRLAKVKYGGAPRAPPLPPHRLHEGMKTSLPASASTVGFSHPTSYGSANDLLLQKQRKAERNALRAAAQMASKKPGAIGRQLPW